MGKQKILRADQAWALRDKKDKVRKPVAISQLRVSAPKGKKKK